MSVATSSNAQRLPILVDCVEVRERESLLDVATRRHLMDRRPRLHTHTQTKIGYRKKRTLCGRISDFLLQCNTLSLSDFFSFFFFFFAAATRCHTSHHFIYYRYPRYNVILLSLDCRHSKIGLC
jgi:hypothetical protein